MFYSRLRELLVAAGGGQWVVHFYCGKEHLHVRRCQILILQIRISGNTSSAQPTK